MTGTIGLGQDLAARTWAGVLVGLAPLPNAHASMVPTAGLYEVGPVVA